MSTRGPDDLLRHALHARADDTSYPATPVADVAARAGRMRRRRRGVLAGVVAAVVITAAVPTLALRGERTAVVEPAVGPDSAPPSIGYLVDGTYHSPDGTESTLPTESEQVSSVTPTSEGLLIIDRLRGSRSYRVAYLDPDGTTRALGTTSSPTVTSADGSTWAYMLDTTVYDYTGVVVEGDGSRETRAQIPRGSKLLGIDGDTLRVTYANADVTQVSSVQTNASDDSTRRLPDVRDVQDFNAQTGRFVVVTDREAVTTAVLDATGEELWAPEDDGTLLGSFSPDGDLVLGTTDSLDLVVYDAATGRPRTSVPADDVSELRAVVWEDDTHLLGLERGGDGLLHAVRLDLDGDVTAIEGMDPVEDENDLVWQTRP